MRGGAAQRGFVACGVAARCRCVLPGARTCRVCTALPPRSPGNTADLYFRCAACFNNPCQCVIRYTVLSEDYFSCRRLIQHTAMLRALFASPPPPARAAIMTLVEFLPLGACHVHDLGTYSNARRLPVFRSECVLVSESLRARYARLRSAVAMLRFLLFFVHGRNRGRTQTHANSRRSAALPCDPNFRRTA